VRRYSGSRAKPDHWSPPTPDARSSWPRSVERAGSGNEPVLTRFSTPPRQTSTREAWPRAVPGCQVEIEVRACRSARS
jgi:hypothetical protein